MGCAKCKAGLCPAYVPSVDSENVQPQDLSPKGRIVTDKQGNYALQGPEAHKRVLVALLLSYKHPSCAMCILGILCG